MTCNVISGDLPIDIKWLKDYQLIPTFLNITEMRVKFLSYLIFEELERDHSGVYTCSVSNAASTANHSATLSVKGKKENTTLFPLLCVNGVITTINFCLICYYTDRYFLSYKQQNGSSCV